MKGFKLIYGVFIIALILLLMGSVCADVENTNSTLQSQDEIEVSQDIADENLQEESQDENLGDDVIYWVDMSITPKYGVSGKEIYVTPTAKFNDVDIPGNTTFYSDIDQIGVMGIVSTKGGYIQLPTYEANGSAGYFPVYYTFLSDDNRYECEDFDYFWIMNENPISLTTTIDANKLNLTVKPTFYKATGDQSRLHVFVNNREVGTFSSLNSTYSLNMNDYNGNLDVYVKYDGYIDEKHSEYYAPGESNHFVMSLDIIFTNTTYGNVTAVITMPYAGNCTVSINSTQKYERKLIFDNLGNKTITIPDIAASTTPYNVTVSSGVVNIIRSLTVSKAIPTINVINVCGNNTDLGKIHNFTVSAQGKGKITTNCTSKEFNLGETIVLNNTFLKVGRNKILIRYGGDENYTEAIKIIEFNLNYNKVNVTPKIDLNITRVIEGGKVLITANATYGIENNKPVLKGNVSVYNDNECKNLLATIPIGGNYSFVASRLGNDQSSYGMPLYLKYNGFVDDINNYTSNVTYAGKLIVMNQNSMNLTINGNTESVDFVANQTLTLAVNLKYYQSEPRDDKFESNIIIFVNDEPYAKFNATNINTIDIGQIRIEDMGIYSVCAYYGGFNGTNPIAPVKSNEVILFFAENTTITLNASNVTPKYHQSITITPLVKYNNAVTLTNGTVTYFIGKTQISDELTLDKSFNFMVDRVGLFNITAKFSGYDYYGPSECNIIINAQKADNNVYLTIPQMTYGENMTVAIFDAINGVYKVSIGDNIVLVNVTNGYGLNMTEKLNLTTGNYSANVFLENNYYNTTGSTTFNVLPAFNDVMLTVSNITYTDNLTVSISNAVPGDYVVSIGDIKIMVRVDESGNGMNNTFIDLAIKDGYEAMASLENPNYLTNASTIFNVCKINSRVEIISCSSVVYPSDLIVVINIENETSASYEIIDETYQIIREGHVNSTEITIHDLRPGNYLLKVTNSENDYFLESSDTIEFEIIHPNLSTYISATPIVEENNVLFIVAVLKNATGLIQLDIGEKTVYMELKYGIASYSEVLSSGDYNFRATYWGDDFYSPVSTTGAFTLLKTVILASKVTATYNANKYIVATLKDGNGKPLADQKISITLNEKIIVMATDKNGQVKLTTKGLVPKTYAVKLTFNGKGNYIKSSTIVEVKINKVKPIMKAKKKTFKKFKTVKKYSISLKDINKKAIKKVSVTLKINGKKFKAKTNSKGKAVFKLKKLSKKGKYVASIKFKGNKYYKSIIKKVKITIK